VSRVSVRDSRAVVGRAPQLQSVRHRVVTVAPIRLGVGLLGLVAARTAGASSAQALVAFAVGTLGFAFAALADPRRRFFAPRQDPVPAPPGVRFESRFEPAAGAIFPSTVGVALLTAVALVPAPTLSALLAGGIAGMGVAAAVSVPRVVAWEDRLGGRLWHDRATDTLYVRRM